jgi:aryl-alcohol dehydrogenase-like predicted oxidoreductase
MSPGFGSAPYTGYDGKEDDDVEYRFLGATGLRVSELCLGAMTFGREADEGTSREIMDRFVAADGNFIDTADVYGRGVSEEVVGRWLAGKPRDSLVIATKVRFTMGGGPNDVGLSRKHILAGVEASLRRLGTDYIDLYQVHCWDDATPLEETLSTLHMLVQSGKVRYLGASNYNGWQLQKAVDISKHNHWEPFTCLQPQYNLLCRSTEWELVDVCRREGLGIIPWSPLRGGWLSGKYRRDMEAPPRGSRVAIAEEQGWSESWSAYNNEHTWQIIDALLDVAGETGRAPAQVAINWLLRKPGVTAPIIGARSLEQLESNLGAAGWALNEEQVAQLDRASDPGRPYPYDFIAGALRRR